MNRFSLSSLFVYVNAAVQVDIRVFAKMVGRATSARRIGMNAGTGLV